MTKRKPKKRNNKNCSNKNN